jgi:hypothetical protein
MKQRNVRRAAAVAFVIAVTGVGAVLVAHAQAPRKERLTFAPGASSATVKGQIKGDADVDYLVRAGAGQTITVSLKPSNRSNYFNVLPPGSENVAMYAGQTGEDYTGMLPGDGDYTIRVYLVRAAARRNEVSDYTLTVSVTGKALAPLPGSGDAKLPGTPYHASTELRCLTMPSGGAKPASCQAFVVRRGRDGTATVEIDMGQNLKRRILFVAGRPVATDSSQTFTSTRKNDVTTVTFENGEFYDIVDALIFGG